MNLVLTRGCTANNLEYGDDSLYDMDNIAQYEVLKKLIDVIAIKQDLINIIETLIESYYTDCSYSDPCEQCGDIVTTYEIEI